MVYFLHTRVARRAVGTASKMKTHTERADPAVAKVSGRSRWKAQLVQRQRTDERRRRRRRRRRNGIGRGNGLGNGRGRQLGRDRDPRRTGIGANKVGGVVRLWSVEVLAVAKAAQQRTARAFARQAARGVRLSGRCARYRGDGDRRGWRQRRRRAGSREPRVTLDNVHDFHRHLARLSEGPVLAQARLLLLLLLLLLM
jgi:hypothetical protein